jgi:TolB-like protein/Tfp pilus assembly protein PilF
MSLFEELKRRNVFRVGIAYAVSAWVVLQLLDVVGEILELPAWGGKLILAVLVTGFFVTLFVAWAYELTPEGIKRESEVDRSQSITAQTGRKLNALILTLMALAIAYLLFDKFYLAPRLAERETAAAVEAAVPAEPIAGEATGAPDRLSIAVLPFENRSAREQDQFFTDGIHDDLLTTIARIGSMKVISRTSVMEYRGTTKKIPEIAAELGVANVLEGGIQRSGEQVRINVQLIDAQTDEHLWAETFDRELTAENLFAIQSEISTRIAEALQATLSPAEEQRIRQMPTANLDAYDAYLRGRQLMATRVIANLKQSVEEFRRAVELDPQFALAWVGLADSLDLATAYADAPEAETIAQREEAVAQALALDPGLGEAYASLANIHDYYDRDDEMEQAFRKAIELSPNYATAYHWYSVVLIRKPLRSRQRLDLLLKAAELDPRSMIIGNGLAIEYMQQGLFSRGEQQALKMTELYPDFPNGHHALVDFYFLGTGEYAKAFEQARFLWRLDTDSFDALRHQIDILVAIGDFAAARAVQERIADMDPQIFWAAWADFLVAIAQRNGPAIRETGEWILARAGDRPWFSEMAAQAMLIAGDLERSRALFQQHFSLDAEDWEPHIQGNPVSACAFAWILMNTGEPELGQALLEQATTWLEDTLPAAIEHADRFSPDVCYLVAGDADKALDSLETQLAHGHFQSWQFDHQMPMYALIEHEPRYRELLAERERRVAEQRALIEAMEL